MRVALLSIFLTGAGLSTVSAAEGLPTDDPSLRPYQERTASYLRRCPDDLNHVEQSNCYADQIASLRIRVAAEFKKRMAAAEAEAAEGDRGGMSGADRVKRLKTALKRAQTAWDSYTKAECGLAFEEVEINGGNSGDLSQGSCMIRHLVNRYNELRR